MTTSEVRSIIEETLMNHGLDDEEAVEVTESIIEALRSEGFLDSYDDEPDEEIDY